MINQALKKALVGATALATLAGATFATTAADARPWGWRGPGPAVAAVGAGLLGVAIGASLAHPYYGPPPIAYGGPGYWGYDGGCRSYWRWSPYWGHYVRVTSCY
jgi:hypothetical protein